MSTLSTLIWLEVKRTTWVIYGTLIAFALYALVLFSLPAVVTGLDVMQVPDAGSPTGSAGQSKVEMSRESEAGTSSFNWSFSKTWGSESDLDPQQEADREDPPRATPSNATVDLPEELQLAFRPRQALTAGAAFFLTGLMLLGFWIAHYRETDRGEMALLYQSPVSGSNQLALRMLYMTAAAGSILVAVLAIYWIAQTSQSLSPTAPLAEGFGGRVQVHWGNMALATVALHILPNVAFILLFIQMHNAYGLLGGQRMVGMVVVLAAFVLGISVFASGATAPESAESVLRIVSVESNPTLDAVAGDFEPGRYRIDIAMGTIAVSFCASFVMLVLSGRIWREVEWS